MRFLGKRLVETFRGEVITSYKHRPEGICVRHACAGKSIKMYDKQGSVLRIETTTNNPAEFKRRRRAEGDPDSEFKLRPLRKGIADMRGRAITNNNLITNGFRNRDILSLVHPEETDDPVTRRKAASRLSRHLRLLCAHKVIRRIEGTHRYVVTTNGRTLITAVVATPDASISKLKQCA